MKIKALIAALMMLLVVSCTDPAPRTYSNTDFPAPQAMTVGAVTESSMEFTWDEVPGAPRYRVRLSENADLSNSVYQRSTGASTIEKFEGLKNNTTYYAAVRVITEDGQDLSPYSQPASAKTFAPVDPSPAPSD